MIKIKTKIKKVWWEECLLTILAWSRDWLCWFFEETDTLVCRGMNAIYARQCKRDNQMWKKEVTKEITRCGKKEVKECVG
jgi:hypothetical protein